MKPPENKPAQRKSGFQPGVSGNPGGRPKGVANLQAKCREFTANAVKALTDALQDADARVRIAAAQVLLERGWGKAAQPVTGVDGGPISLEINLNIGGGK